MGSSVAAFTAYAVKQGYLALVEHCVNVLSCFCLLSQFSSTQHCTVPCTNSPSLMLPEYNSEYV